MKIFKIGQVLVYRDFSGVQRKNPVNIGLEISETQIDFFEKLYFGP